VAIGHPAPFRPQIGHRPYGFFGRRTWQSRARSAAAIDWIVDIAADRFGADPVIVTPACAPRDGAGECDTAFAGFIAARRRTVDALWPVWRARRAGR